MPNPTHASTTYIQLIGVGASFVRSLIPFTTCSGRSVDIQCPQSHTLTHRLNLLFAFTLC